MPNKLNVLTGGPKEFTGGTFRAPLATAVPSDATTALASGFVDGGYVGEDGLTMNIAKSQEKIRDWGKSVVKVIQTEHDVTFNWEYIEFSKEAAESFFGAENVTFTAGTVADPEAEPPVVGTPDVLTVEINDKTTPVERWVFEMADGDVDIRVVVPQGQLASEGGEFAFNKNGVIRIPMAIEALKDDATGNNAVMYKVSPAAA